MDTTAPERPTYPAGSAVVIQSRDDDPLGQRYAQGPDHVRHSTYDRVGLVTSVTGETGLAGPVYVVEMLDGKVLRLRAEHLSEANPATTIKACREVFGRPVTNSASEAQAAGIAARRGHGPFPLTVSAPGFYTVGLHDGLLAVDSFTSDAVLDADPEDPEDKPGVWVASQVDPDHFGVWVDSIHEDEVEAWRALDTEATRPRVTFVEFGAPARQVIRETHAL